MFRAWQFIFWMADIKKKKKKHYFAAESKGSLSDFNFKNTALQVNKLFWNWHATKKFLQKIST